MKQLRDRLVLTAAMILASAAINGVAAQKFLEGEALQAALSDKTISFKSRNGSATSFVYFASDGKLTSTNSERKDIRLEGTWRVKRAGFFSGPKELLCRKYNGRPERCARVLMEKGTAKFVDEKNKPLYTAKVMNGQSFPK